VDVYWYTVYVHTNLYSAKNREDESEARPLQLWAQRVFSTLNLLRLAVITDRVNITQRFSGKGNVIGRVRPSSVSTQAVQATDL